MRSGPLAMRPGSTALLHTTHGLPTFARKALTFTTPGAAAIVLGRLHGAMSLMVMIFSC